MKQIIYTILFMTILSCSNWVSGQVVDDLVAENMTLLEDVDTKNESEKLSLVISPNPTNNNFNISKIDQVGKVEVYNIIGAKVKSFDTRQSTTFDVIDLPSGIYLVRAYNKSNTNVLATLRLKKR